MKLLLAFALLLSQTSVFATEPFECGGLFGAADREISTIRERIENMVSFRVREPEFPGPRFEEVSPGRVFRGPLPWNESAMEFLKAKGVRKIYSLIMHEGDIAAEKALADAQGIDIEFVRIPNFLANPDRETILRVVNDLGRAAKGELPPAYVHCRRGKDRTGLVIGLHEVLNMHKDPRDVYAHMRDLGFAPVLRPLLRIWTEMTGYNPVSTWGLRWWGQARDQAEKEDAEDSAP